MMTIFILGCIILKYPKKSTEQIYIFLCLGANPLKEMFHNPVKWCAQ